MNMLGLLVSTFYVAIIGFLRWDSFPTILNMPLNEFGDFLAGVFGPLMLFWVVMGYFQQQRELRQNTKTLEIQAEELRKSVEQHRELVSIAKEQANTDLRYLAIEEYRHIRETQPNLRITKAGCAISSDGVSGFAIRIENIGMPANSVSVTTEPELIQVKERGYCSYLDTDGKFIVAWSSNISGQAPEKLRVIINCNDKNEKKYSTTFNLVLAPNNEYMIESIE